MLDISSSVVKVVKMGELATTSTTLSELALKNWSMTCTVPPGALQTSTSVISAPLT